MKKISILCIASILTLLMTGCPFVTPGILYIGLEVPEWIDEAPVSDTFTPDKDIQEYFYVSSWEENKVKERKYSDEDGKCWFEFKDLETSCARLYLYFGDKDKDNTNFIFLGHTFDHDYVNAIEERDGVYEFDCNSNSISPVYDEDVDEDKYGYYKIKHMKFVKLEDGYNLYLTVDGKEIGPYHFTRAKSVDVAK
jgi:hypothetical protein